MEITYPTMNCFLDATLRSEEDLGGGARADRTLDMELFKKMFLPFENVARQRCEQEWVLFLGRDQAVRVYPDSVKVVWERSRRHIAALNQLRGGSLEQIYPAAVLCMQDLAAFETHSDSKNASGQMKSSYFHSELKAVVLRSTDLMRSFYVPGELPQGAGILDPKGTYSLTNPHEDTLFIYSTYQHNYEAKFIELRQSIAGRDLRKYVRIALECIVLLQKVNEGEAELSDPDDAEDFTNIFEMEEGLVEEFTARIPFIYRGVIKVLKKFESLPHERRLRSELHMLNFITKKIRFICDRVSSTSAINWESFMAIIKNIQIQQEEYNRDMYQRWKKGFELLQYVRSIRAPS